MSRIDVPSCRQHFITLRKARFDNRATQTPRTARHKPKLRHPSSYYSQSVPQDIRIALAFWDSYLLANVVERSSLDTAYLRKQIGGQSSGLMITFHESTS